MILYGSSLSPFVRKTMAYLSEKGLSAELKPVVFQAPDEAFRSASPFGKMPGFRDGDFAISDSTAIITYLEAKCPDPALLPTEAKNRARTIWYEEFADTILAACMGKMFFNRLVAPRFSAARATLRPPTRRKGKSCLPCSTISSACSARAAANIWWMGG